MRKILPWIVILACFATLFQSCTKDQSGPGQPEEGTRGIVSPPTDGNIPYTNIKYESLSREFLERIEPLLNELNRNPSNADAISLLGFEILDPGLGGAPNKYAKSAQSLFQKAVSMDPGNRTARLGILHLTKNISDDLLKEKYLEFNRANQNLGVYEGTPDGIPLDIIDTYFASLYQDIDSRAAWQRAFELCRKAISQNPENPLPHQIMAQLYVNLDDLEQCRKSANRAIQLAETSGQDYIVLESKHILSTILRSRRQYEEAEKLLNETRITKKGAPWACAYQALGGLYREMGKPTKEATASMKASDLYADSHEAAFNAALACFWIGDYKNAEKYIEKALGLKARVSYHVLKGHLLLFRSEHRKAKKLFRKLKKEYPTHHGGEIGLGHLAVVRKKYEKAVSLFQPALQDPLSVSAFEYTMANIGMAWALSNQNKHAKALQYAESALQENRSNILALLAKGNVLVGLNRLKEGEETYRKILAAQPDNPYAMAELGIVQYKLGRDDRAEEALRKAIALDSGKYTCPYEGLGLLYLKQGKIDKAKKNLKKAIDLNPDIEYKKFNALAKIYLKEGKEEKAKKLLRKSIANFPYNNEAKRMLETLESDESG